MSDKVITFLLSFSITLIILLLIVIWVDIYKIKKKNVKEIRVYRTVAMLDNTIIKFEKLGYEVVDVVNVPNRQGLFMIIFVKVK